MFFGTFGVSATCICYLSVSVNNKYGQKDAANEILRTEVLSRLEQKKPVTVVTVIIMEAFINKMRRLHGVRKMIVVEEAWKAIAREGMADYIKFLCAPVKVAS